MLLKTKGIVLHMVKYTDSASILTVFTRQIGRVSYMVYGTSGKRSSVRSAYLQPLTILDIEANHHQKSDIQKIKEVCQVYPLHELRTDSRKNAIVIFLAEILYRTLRQGVEEDLMFDFIEDSVIKLDQLESGIGYFHLIFLLKLTRYLGFFPNTENAKGKYFDLQNGIFVEEKPLHKEYVSSVLSLCLREMLQCDFDKMTEIKIDHDTRVRLLNHIVEYYGLHMSGFQKINSLEILHSLFV